MSDLQKKILKSFILILSLFFVYYYMGYVVIIVGAVFVVLSFIKPKQVEKAVDDIEVKIESLKKDLT